jgi:thiazole/oxazole-forming peptide maturase SagC family component
MKQATLRIKPHYSIIPHSAQQVELRTGVWNPTSFILTDESNSNKLFCILKDLNGHSSIVDIAKKHNISRAEVETILDQLQQLNVTESATTEVSSSYADQLAIDSLLVEAPLNNILIIGEDLLGNEIKRILGDTISHCHIKTMNLQDSFIKNLKTNTQWLFDSFMLQDAIDKFSEWQDYFIVLAMTQNDPILAMRLNQINHTLNIPWIHGVIDGPFIFIGPAFTAKSGPCYHCFEKRVTMNLHEYASYQRYKELSITNELSGKNDRRKTPAIYVLAAHMAMEVANYHYTKMCFTRSKALSIYLPTMEICFNEVLRLSGCPVCGAVPHRDDQQLYYDYQTVLENVS